MPENRFATAPADDAPPPNRFATQSLEPPAPPQVGLASHMFHDLIGPGLAAWGALKTDVERNYDSTTAQQKPGDWRNWVPGFSQQDRTAGSVIGDVAGLVTSPVSGIVNLMADGMTAIPGMGDKEKNADILSKAMMGLGAKGLKAGDLGSFGGEPPFTRNAYTGPRSGGGRFRTAAEAEEQFKARGGSSTAGSDRFGPKPEPEPKPADAPKEAPGPAAPPHKVVAGARMDADSRFELDPNGHVLAENGDAQSFPDQKAAARWIIQSGQKESADQIFEIANHPDGKGFAARETGRAARPPEPMDFVKDGETPLGDTGLSVVSDHTETPGVGEAPPPEPPPPSGHNGPPEPLDFVSPVKKRGRVSDIKAAVNEKGLPGAIADWASHLYTAGVSEQHPLVRAVEDLRSTIEGITGKPENLAPSKDPRKLARGGYDVFNIGHMDIMHGVHPYRGADPASPALSDVIAAATDADVRNGDTPAVSLHRFNSYLTALRGVEEWDRYAKGEIPNEPLPVKRGGDRASLVDHIMRAEAANPHYAALASAVNEYGRALWTKQFDAGLLSPETYAAANAARSFYVPFKRVMDEGAAKSGSGATNKASAAKKFKGSDRDVIAPVETLAKQTYEVSRRIRQNDINMSLIKLAKKADALLKSLDPTADTGANGVLRKIKRPMTATHVSPEELKARGIDDALFGDESAEFWRPGEINEGGRPIIYGWENGKREAWEFMDPEWGRDTYNSISGMSQAQSDLWMAVLQVASSTLRAGITTHPEFAIANLIKDQLTTWVNTDVGFIPGEGLVGTAKALTGDDVMRRYAVGGGITGGQAVAGVRDAAIHADIMALRNSGFKATYLSSLEGALSLTEVTETGTRLAVFDRAFQRAKAEGMSDYDAILEAAFAARDVLDFGRNGSRLHFTRRTVTFLNASIQGLDKTLRVVDASGAYRRIPLKEALKPLLGRTMGPGVRNEDKAAIKLAYKAYAKMGAIMMFGLALTAAYRDDEEYQNISEYGRASAWWFKLGPLGWFAIPKPFTEGLPSTIAERSFEAIYHDDPKAWGRLARGSMQALALPTDNPFTKTTLELGMNKNIDTGAPIVPYGKEGLMPADQYAYWNSTFSEALGKRIGVSPAKIDFAMAGYFGSWGRTAQAFSNMTDPDRPEMGLSDLPISRRFFHDWQRGAQDKTDFYTLVGSKTSGYAELLASVRDRAAGGKLAEAKALIDQADPNARIYVWSQIAEDGKVKGLNPLTRAQTVGTEISRLIAEMYGERAKGVAMHGDQIDEESQLPHLNAHQKAVTQDALERLAVSEFHNAMVATGEEGFANKPLMQRDAYMKEVEAASPAMAAVLKRRLLTGREKAMDYHAVMRAWPVAAARLRRDGEGADLSDLMADVRGESVPD